MSNKRITEKYAKKFMAFKALREEVKQNQREREFAEKNAEQLLIDRHEEYGISPVEVLAKREREQTQSKLIKHLKSILSKTEFKIIWKTVVQELSQEELAKELSVDRTTITKRIPNIFQKIRDKTTPEFLEQAKNIIYSYPSFREADGPTTFGWPFQIQQRVNIGGRWIERRDKTSYFKSEEACHIPEYLEEAFGDKLTVCNMCSKCTRLDYYNQSLKLSFEGEVFDGYSNEQRKVA